MNRPISSLYELCIKKQLAPPKFTSIDSNTPSSFTVDCMVGDCREQGVGDTKRVARHNAALAVFTKLLANGTEQTSNAKSQSGIASRYETTFRDHQFLGHGSSGVVFKAKSIIDGYYYALKLITIAKGDENRRDKVLREVDIQELDNAHVVHYVDAWTESVPSKIIEDRFKPHVLCDYFNNLVSGQSDSSQSNSSSSGQSQSSADAFRFNSGVHQALNDVDLPSAIQQIQEEVLVLHIQLQLCDRTLEDWIEKDNDRIFNERKSNPDGPSRVGLRDRSTVLNIYEQIVKALRYVHGKGIMHRDLKPSNIYFALDGRIVVGDLGSQKKCKQAEKMSCLIDSSEAADGAEGSSKQQSGNRVNSQVTECHSANLGTVPYCAPETLPYSSSKVAYYSKEVDIYSLGIILLQLLYPCTSREFGDILGNLDVRLPAILQSNADCELLNSMLSRLPTNRPSAAELLASDPLLTHRRGKKLTCSSMTGFDSTD